MGPNQIYHSETKPITPNLPNWWGVTILLQKKLGKFPNWGGQQKIQFENIWNPGGVSIFQKCLNSKYEYAPSINIQIQIFRMLHIWTSSTTYQCYQGDIVVILKLDYINGTELKIYMMTKFGIFDPIVPIKLRLSIFLLQLLCLTLKDVTQHFQQEIKSFFC